MKRFLTLLLVQLALVAGWISRSIIWPALGQPTTTWVLSDFDQTIYGTEEARAAYYAREYASLGRTPADLPSGQAADIPPATEYALVRNWEPDEAAFAEYVAVRKDAMLCEGAFGFLLSTVASGRRIGIVSSGYQARINDLLDRDGLSSLFQFVVAVDDLEEGFTAAKPRPDLYLIGAARTGIDKKGIVAIEDSPSGLGGAFNAGLDCLFVPSSSRPLPAAPDGVRITVLQSLRDARLG
jgi:beta-phosphoglucomutase-like phosphatase (HAD superfamily)